MLYRERIFLWHTRRHFKRGSTGNTTQEVWALAREISHNSVNQLVLPALIFLTVIYSCVDVPCTNRVPILPLPVRLFIYFHSPSNRASF